MYKRIFIFGATGSGKTTLAERVSIILKKPFYTTDDMVYKKLGKDKHPKGYKENNLKDIAKKDNWIIEGVHDGKWIIPAIKRAEIIIILNIKRLILYDRIIKRYLLKRKVHYDSPKSLFKMLYWAYIYKKDNYVNHIKMVKEYKKKCLFLKNNKDINEFLLKIKNQ